MNILFLIPSLANGGQERAGMVLCNYLQQFHKLTVVCLEARHDNEFDYQSPVIRIVLPKRNSLFGKISNGIQRIKELKKIRRQIQPDVTIAFGNTAIMLIAFAGGREVKIASVRQSLSSNNNHAISGRIQHWLYGRALKKSNLIVPVTSRINEELKTIFSIQNNLYVHNGCHREEIFAKSRLPIAEKWAAFFNSQVIAHMGRFDTSKCNWELVKIFSLIKEQVPAAKLLLIGKVDHSSEVNQRIYEFCIRYLQSKSMRIAFYNEDEPIENIRQADVLIAGQLPNPFPFLSRAQIFAFPSAWEGFPNAVLEAMAAGSAVVAADCPTGPAEILAAADQNFGYLLPMFKKPFDENDSSTNDIHGQWAATIIGLLSNSEILASYAALALRRVADFDPELSNKKWLSIIETGNSAYSR